LITETSASHSQKWTCRSDYQVQEWHITDSIADITVRREGVEFQISGTYDSKPLSKKHLMPNLPWYQSIDYAFSKLILTPSPTRFIYIRKRDLKPIVMILTRSYSKVHQQQYTVRMKGFFGLFWKIRYTIDSKSGTLLKKEILTNPKVIVTPLGVSP